MDAVVSALAYWAFGHAFAYGRSNNVFIGNSTITDSKKSVYPRVRSDRSVQDFNLIDRFPYGISGTV